MAKAGLKLKYYYDTLLYIAAEVGLEKTFYQVSETDGVVVVCVVIYEPDISCPIEFPFDVMLSTIDGSAGKISEKSHLGLKVWYAE